MRERFDKLMPLPPLKLAGSLTETVFAEEQRSDPFTGVRWPRSTLRAFRNPLPHRHGFDIRPAKTPHQHVAASMLVQRMYAWRGYKTESLTLRPDDPYRITLAAWQSDTIIATLTLRRDSPHGLLADALYAREIERLRCPSRILCEVSRLAVAPDFSTRELLARLFQAALEYARNIFVASDAVIEVNPRHAPYYQHQLGFLPLGEPRHCQRVGAPAVLLHQTLNSIAIRV